ncbi:addiction module protein [Salinisphaera sp. P385]|uniref:Addiction module protein n=1 Tax=Spectribacter acetivorans TaxID=3075603 RepID=A0ABU3B9P8_9GAMM|nr:addiction module protein [Salinisphaera sp. P385]MDT0619194.1 addiction module protein [Salinisphaera sp. P385]
MNDSPASLEQTLLALPRNERARMASRLIASLDDAAETDTAAVQAAWIEEADRRYRAYLDGKEPAYAADEVIRDLLREND